MNNRIFIFTVLALAGIVACRNAEVVPEEDVQTVIEPEPVVRDITANDCWPGHLRVLLSEELESTEAVAKLLSQALEVKSVTPTFPDDPRFTERHRAAGLHLWYNVQYDPDEALTKASIDISSLPGIELVEGLPKTSIESAPFNDPKYNNQWHYHNTAQRNNFIAGSDINLEDAWEYETGSENVIVAVIDVGVLYTHEELADNMWVNEAEANGIEGKDDDGNGYVDDIHGYNFCWVESYYKMHGTIVPEDHATHVAGTIAAKNNNGRGGCGIAGGDGVHRGVRIMNCQMIQSIDETHNYPGDCDAAIVYAADNGASIANNSWGGSRSEATRRAIKYFNDYAGVDANGRQNGPMKGGVCFFASGNEDRQTGYPAQYDEAYAVASIGPNFQRAYYSNYGTWVDICAPGGDQQYGVSGGVYSCTATTNSSYDYYQGTSMACPHVTGVAALAVSAFGGEGFTRDDLINILNESANPDVYDYNSSYKGKLGIGLLDAGAMFRDSRPQEVKDFKVTPFRNTLVLEWTAPATNEGTTLAAFEIEFDTGKILYETPSAREGDKLSYTLDGLEYDTEYSVAIRAVNSEGKMSKRTGPFTVRTEANRPPVITVVDSTHVSVFKNSNATLHFTVKDPEGDKWTGKVEGKTIGLSYRLVDDSTVEVEFRGASIYGSSGAGKYKATLYATDEAENTSSLELEYTVINHKVPSLKKPVEDMVATVGKTAYITLADYFDYDGDVMVRTVVDNPFVASAIEEYGTVGLKALKPGKTDVKIEINDRYGMRVETAFVLVTREDAKAEIYPTSVSDFFYVRTGVSRDLRVRVVSTTGAVVIDEIHTDVSAMKPARIYIPENCAPGLYTVIVDFTADGSQVKQNIVILK